MRRFGAAAFFLVLLQNVDYCPFKQLANDSN